MNKLILATLLLIFTSAASAKAQTNWLDLLTMSGTKVSAVYGATRIDITTAKAMYDDGRLFVDVQGFFEWKRSHIAGALLGASITEVELAEVADKNKEIVFYCDCDLGSATCNLSPKASAKAASWGYEKIYYFTNYNEWKAAGYPTEKES
jgi:rhodanese-related sulfurtransferase